jgi:hypothetical protein
MASIDPQKNYTNQFQNGRVENVNSEVYKNFPMFYGNNNDNNSFKSEALKGIQQESVLSNLFFSNPNMKIIQDEIRYGVWLKSGKKYKVDAQDLLQIELVMRAIYLQYSKNLDYNYRQQIQELNYLVQEYCIPKVFAETQQYLGYLDDIQKLPQPIPLPDNVSAKGTKSLRSLTTTF